MADHVPVRDDRFESKSQCFEPLSNTSKVERQIVNCHNLKITESIATSSSGKHPERQIINSHNLKITELVAASSSGKHPVYRGIRSRSGKWVAEIREPRKTTRIWLGTYPTPEMAAAAYDAASLLLKGPDTALNFPDHKHNNLLLVPTEPPTAAMIRVAAANAAASRAVASQSLALPASDDQLEQSLDSNVNENSATDLSEIKESYVDEEELFDMPNLLMAMAEGMLVSPPRNTISPPPSDDSESLWSFSL